MLIVFEGSAGSGKTTQALLLEKYLSKERKLKTFYSAAFEGKRKDLVASFIDDIKMSKTNDSVMFLFQALHSLQFKEVKDFLETNNIVIADRWRESFLVYHTFANTFVNYQDLMEKIDKFTFKDLEPDMYVYINVTPEIAHKRYQDREKEFGNNGLKLMNLEYFKWVNNIEKPGSYTPVGGSIEEGENPDDALVREIQEESNMKVLHFQPIGYQKVSDVSGVHKPYYQLRYFCIVEPYGPFVSDLAGKVTEVLQIDPLEYKKHFDWGEIGDSIINRALELKKEL